MKNIPLATYVTWEELNARPSTIEELRTNLASLPRLQVVQACAIINLTLRTWKGTIDSDEHERLLRIFFPKSFADRLNSIARRQNNRAFVFHRQQLLFLMREAIVHSPDGPDIERNFEGKFAECCLRANDLLHHGLAAKRNLSPMERLLPEFVAITDITDRQSILRRTARTSILLDEILNRPRTRSRPQFVDIPKLFLAATGLTIREYSTLTFGILTKYVNLTLEKYAKERGALVTSRQYFGQTKIDSPKVELFLNDLSSTFDSTRTEATKATHLSDFTALRNRPLIRMNADSYFPLDIGFVVDKLETGVFWRVHAACSSNQQKQNLHNLWGYLFHDYVTELLTGVDIGDKTYFVKEPSFRQGDEVCDGAIRSGSDTVLLEYKASMLTANAKYSGSPDVLLRDIDTKFIGTSDRPKGIRQLARSVERCWNKRQPEAPQELSRAARIFPVLIGKDPTLGSPYMNKYLNTQFRHFYNRKHVSLAVTPLFVLTIDELESIVPYLSSITLHEILEAKYKADKDLDWPFSVNFREALAGQPERHSKELEDKFDHLINEACIDFFGKPLEAEPAVTDK